MQLIADLARLDLAATERSNRFNSRPAWARLFAAVSRLGDGWAWYALAAGLLMGGGAGAMPAVAVMAGCGVAGSAIYALLKRCTRRERPCAIAGGLVLTVAPLDRFSFPSGHTLHAVAFATVASAHLPWLAVAVWPFAALVAASRLVLGLHYPSDVLVGGALGLLIAEAGMAVAGL